MQSVSNGQSTVHHFFFFNDTATTEIYTLSLHDALPISIFHVPSRISHWRARETRPSANNGPTPAAAATSSKIHNIDRKSTRLNSSHANISYAVFCLKKKKLGF